MPVKRISNKKVYARLKSMQDDVRVSVGWFPSAVYPDGTPTALVANWLEFGTSNKDGGQRIPPFSMMRITIADNSKRWRTIMKLFLQTDETALATMERFALVAEGDLKKTISTITKPALQASTLAGRRSRGNTSEKPLVDTGYMLATVSSKVEAA